MKKTLSTLLSLCLAFSAQAPLFAASYRLTAPASSTPAPLHAAPVVSLPPAVTLPGAPALSGSLPGSLPGAPASVTPAAAAAAGNPAAAAAANPAASAAQPADTAGQLRQALEQAPLETICRLPEEQASGVGAALLGEVAPGQGAAANLPASGAESSQPAPALERGKARNGRLTADLPPGPPPPKPFFHRHYRLLQILSVPLVKLLYRVDVRGLENIPEGPALLLPNHGSFVDPLLLGFAIGRPVRFMMYRRYYDIPVLTHLWKAVGAIPVSEEDSGSGLKEAIRAGRQALLAGEKVVIFPEGAVSHTGNLAPFKRGFELLARGTGAAVIPVHIDGLWGSLFSRQKTTTRWQKIREVPRRVSVRVGAPLQKADTQDAREAIQFLGAQAMEARVREKGKTLPREFLATAKRLWRKRSVADSSGRDLTFGRALTGATLLAAKLGPLSAKANVGVLLPPSTGGALANAALGIAGKVPININYSVGPEAVSYALEKADIDTIVTSRAAVEAFQKLKEWNGALPPGRLVYLEDVMSSIPQWKKTLTYLWLSVLPCPVIEALYFRKASRSLDDDATVLFTSGSSSNPKGVELTHLNVRANIEMINEVFPRSSGDLLLGTLPFFHSFGYTITLWFPLIMGLSAAYHSSPLEAGKIGELAEKYKPTMFFTLPSLLVLYARKLKEEAFSSLKLVVTGAEALRSQLASLFEKKFGARPMQGYGATELSPVTAVNLPNVGPQLGNKDGSVGMALPGAAIRAVDLQDYEKAVESAADISKLPSVRNGKPGVLLVYGPHVMKGYLNDPVKTAEALKDRWYVTGDIGIIGDDGFIELVGRVARFSKIAGEMVSQVAVEDKLQQASGRLEPTFVVVGVPDESRGERLSVVYAGWDGEVTELLDKVRAAGLPNLWTPAPSAFHKIDALPMLGSGKVDFKAVKKLALELEAR